MQKLLASARVNQAGAWTWLQLMGHGDMQRFNSSSLTIEWCFSRIACILRKRCRTIHYNKCLSTRPLMHENKKIFFLTTDTRNMWHGQWSKIWLWHDTVLQMMFLGEVLLAAAQKQAASWEILPWMTPSGAPQALQASECSELLDPVRANYWISAQNWPGKLTAFLSRQVD